jgi:hypothetical protein
MLQQAILWKVRQLFTLIDRKIFKRGKGFKPSEGRYFRFWKRAMVRLIREASRKPSSREVRLYM